jgi:Rod binding domain-containing protein
MTNAFSSLMTPKASLTTPNLDALQTGALAGARNKLSSDARMHAQAQDFEVQFVNSMFQNMFTDIKGEGPFGTSTGVAAWRSFLTEEYAKNFVKTGGIGLADSVYKSLLAHQEAQAKPQVRQ